MAVEDIKERKKRQIDEVTEPDKVFALIKAHLAKQKLFVKGVAGALTATIHQIDPKNSLCLIELGEDVQLPEAVKLYKVLGRYVELEGKVVGAKGPLGRVVKIHTARIARFARAHPRYPVKEDVAYVKNIRTTKNTIATSSFGVPTTVKVNLSQAQQQHHNMADIVRIATFDEVKNDEKFSLVQKSGKSLLIADTQAVESYIPTSDDFVDYHEFIGVEMVDVMRAYKQAQIVSEMIVPINYLDNRGNSVPLGFIQLQSKHEYFDQFKYLEAMELSFSIVDRIRDSNMVILKDRQDILDISEGGLKIKVTSDELIRFLVHQAGFTFDVIFKMQQPITFFGRICSTYRDSDGNLVLGVQVQGASSRKGEYERFVLYIKEFIASKQEG